jgi:lipopolysaccharide export system protein LptA
MRLIAPILAILAAIAGPVQAAPPATGATIGAAKTPGATGSGPIDITADQGIEWRQSDRSYMARGNAIAKRGDDTLYADTITAYYRDIPNSSQTEIWRVVADGHVKITTPTQSIVGDHGVYDIDNAVVIITGGALKLTTPQDVVTARDSMEWYDDKQLAVARGNALAVRGDRQLRADTLVAQVATAPGEASRISRVDGTGHVVISGPQQVGSGDNGVYNVDTGIATLSDHVTLARGANTMVGQYGVIDLDKNISRLLPRPPTAQDSSRGRVEGYIVPRQNPAPDAPKAR